MKNIIAIIIITLFCFSCNSSRKTIKQDFTQQVKDNDTVTISSNSLEYDIIIIEPGFNTWLNSIAKLEGFYTKSYLEQKNSFYVTAWNTRVNQPNQFSQNLYEMQINYQSGLDYGYELNYKLYNYFIYFQNTYKQNLLGGRVPIN
jgi:type IV pilus biogenesis protein CpaD/CtpE